MATTSARAFAIFIDDAPPASTTRKLSASSTSRAPSRGTTPAPVDKENKENSQPLCVKDKNTSDVPKGSLKRKTGVLETKLYAPPTSKKARDESRPVLKRRAVSVPLLDTTESFVPLPKTKTVKAPKAGPSTSAAGSAAPAKKKTRRPKVSVSMSLPSVAEEEPVASSSFSMSQAAIDGRCYDLTVSPLADVSEAYDAFGESQLVEDEGDAGDGRSSRAASSSSTAVTSIHITLPTPSSSKISMETQLRDYFAEPVLTARAPSSSKPRPLSRAVSLPAQPFGWSSEPTTLFDDTFFARESTLPTLSSLSSLSSLPSLVDEESFVVDSLESSPELGTPPPAGGLPLRMTTPERKSVYAAFTFATPSPTATIRANSHCRSASLDRFGDIAFVPVA